MYKICGFVLLFSAFTFPAQQSELSKNIFAISGYISSKEYKEILKLKGEEAAIDSIFSRSYAICKGDMQTTLLSLTFACLPYNKFSVIIPLLKLKFTVPVFSADSLLFAEKNKYLPKDMYFDSPNDSYGDKDKLAHFFGGAFLSYSLESKFLATYLGYCVEMFEEVFKLDSKADIRDIRTNTLGTLFGKDMRKGECLSPSAYFAFYNLINIIR